MIRITNRNEILSSILKEANRYNPMTKEQEQEAFARLANGDESARNEIVCANLRYIITEAKKYTSNPDRLCDLIQEGSKGMLKAIPLFDPSKGFKFITFATHYINRAMTNFCCTQSVRQTNDHKLAVKVRKIRREFLAKNEREATLEEVAEILEEQGIKVKDLRDIYSMSISSIDCFVGDDETMTAEENGEFATVTAYSNEYEGEIESESNKAKVAKLLKRLNPKEKEIIFLAYGLGGSEPMDNEAIAEKLGYTKERIRQLVKGAEAKMRA